MENKPSLVKVTADSELEYLRAKVRRQGEVIAKCADMLHVVERGRMALTSVEGLVLRALRHSIRNEIKISKSRWEIIKDAANRP